MGAYDDGGFTRAKSAAEAAGIPTSAPAPSLRESIATADARAEALSSKLDNPNLSPKQFNNAMNAWLNASNAANKLRGQLANSGSGTSTNDYGPSGGNDAGFYAGPPAEPMTPAAIPTALAPAVIQPPPPPVKTAPIDTVLFDDESVSIDIMTDLIFENIGGHELINIARNDIVNGQQVSYQPIKNLSSIQQQYNPNNILSLQSTSDKYFANFAIKLENKVPDPGTGPNGSYVYLDSDTGSMIVEAINLEVDEQIQIEITTSGTIYEAEFGEVTS
jgi:hypothetical protein